MHEALQTELRRFAVSTLDHEISSRLQTVVRQEVQDYLDAVVCARLPGFAFECPHALYRGRQGFGTDGGMNAGMGERAYRRGPGGSVFSMGEEGSPGPGGSFGMGMGGRALDLREALRLAKMSRAASQAAAASSASASSSSAGAGGFQAAAAAAAAGAFAQDGGPRQRAAGVTTAAAAEEPEPEDSRLRRATASSRLWRFLSRQSLPAHPGEASGETAPRPADDDLAVAPQPGDIPGTAPASAAEEEQPEGEEEGEDEEEEDDEEDEDDERLQLPALLPEAPQQRQQPPLPQLPQELVQQSLSRQALPAQGTFPPQLPVRRPPPQFQQPPPQLQQMPQQHDEEEDEAIVPWGEREPAAPVPSQPPRPPPQLSMSPAQELLLGAAFWAVRSGGLGSPDSLLGAGPGAFNFSGMMPPPRRPPTKLQRIVESSSFDFLAGTVVLLNSLSIGMQADYMAKHMTYSVPWFFKLGDLVFLILALTEFSLRFAAHGRSLFSRPCWRWRVLDCVSICLQIVEAIVAFADIGGPIAPPGAAAAVAAVTGPQRRAAAAKLMAGKWMRMLRLTRIMRLARALRVMRHLQAAVNTSADAWWHAGWAMAVLVAVGICLGVRPEELRARQGPSQLTALQNLARDRNMSTALASSAVSAAAQQLPGVANGLALAGAAAVSAGLGGAGAEAGAAEGAATALGSAGAAAAGNVVPRVGWNNTSGVYQLPEGYTQRQIFIPIITPLLIMQEAFMKGMGWDTATPLGSWLSPILIGAVCAAGAFTLFVLLNSVNRAIVEAALRALRRDRDMALLHLSRQLIMATGAAGEEAKQRAIGELRLQLQTSAVLEPEEAELFAKLVGVDPGTLAPQDGMGEDSQGAPTSETVPQPQRRAPQPAHPEQHHVQPQQQQPPHVAQHVDARHQDHDPPVAAAYGEDVSPSARLSVTQLANPYETDDSDNDDDEDDDDFVFARVLDEPPTRGLSGQEPEAKGSGDASLEKADDTESAFGCRGELQRQQQQQDVFSSQSGIPADNKDGGAVTSPAPSFPTIPKDAMNQAPSTVHEERMEQPEVQEGEERPKELAVPIDAEAMQLLAASCEAAGSSHTDGSE